MTAAVAAVLSGPAVLAAASVTVGTPGAERMMPAAPRSALETKCTAGDMASCGELARLLIKARGDKDFERGVVLLEVACGRDDRRSCTTLGTLYVRQEDNAQSVARGLDMLGRACRDGDGPACTAAGNATSAGANGDVDADIKERLDLFRRGCELGDAAGCEAVADEQLGDEGGDRAAGEYALGAACRMGRPDSCLRLGMELRKEPKTRVSGEGLIKATCERGHGRSCMALALPFAPLVGIETMCDVAVVFARRACTAGDAGGCAVVDGCQLVAPLAGSPAADTIARLRASCDRKVALACLYWANAEEQRALTPEEVVKVRQAYARACRAEAPGAGIACVRLMGYELASTENREQAEDIVHSLEGGCRHSPEACCLLAEQYERGKWVKPDATKAAELRAKACARRPGVCCAAKR